MRSIQVLDKETIDKIAAGEVIERPASVIKELCENSIDALATAVTVEIKDGGTTFMRVTDNGGGIPSGQVRTAFLPHATSKIRRAEDLEQIASLGFRGEALPSISAVAMVECITKTPDEITGTRYLIEGGTEKEFEEIGAPSGTTFIVRNLFFNTPARAKFLKTPMTEANHVSSLVEELALSHPGISFKFIQNGQTRLYTSGNGNLKEIVYQVFGRDITRELIPIEDKSEIMHLSGFIGKPNISRGNRNFENYFINGRFVKDAVISRAIEDAYHGFLMQHKFPFTLLYLDIDSTKVDVNVHPRKMEVRLSDQEGLYRQICLAIQNALMNRERIPEVSADPEKRASSGPGPLPVIKRKVPEPFESRQREAMGMKAARDQTYGNGDGTSAYRAGGNTDKASVYRAGGNTDKASVYRTGGNTDRASAYRTGGITDRTSGYSGNSTGGTVDGSSSDGCLKDSPDHVWGAAAGSSGQYSASAAGRPEPGSKKNFAQLDMFREDRVLSEQSRRMFRLIGQVFDTYWIIEYRDSLYIIDQHAAHEKVNYERMMRNYREKKINSQALFPAAVVNVNPREADLLSGNMDAFTSLGFEIEPFGKNSFKINAVPDNLYGVDPEELFSAVLDQLGEIGDIDPALIPERIASMSCKAAVKGNSRLSVQEADALIDELLTLDNPYNCPHGRPTIISISKHELDRKFKRIVS